MILVCGTLADDVTQLVCARLLDCKYPFRFLELRRYPQDFQVVWRWQNGYPSGYIAGATWHLDLADISGVYVRYPDPAGQPAPSGLDPTLGPAIGVECAMGLATLLEALPCVVVNRWWGGQSNNSKPYQALLIRHSGLLTPPTLITTDPAAAQQFYETHNRNVIYKPLSGMNSIVRRLLAEDLARLPWLCQRPMQFQAFIPGENVRVHTVDDQIFATLVHSQAVDYRYAGQEGYMVELAPTTLPFVVANACVQLAQRLGLLLTGIDLMLTPSGDYYCFEINTAPAFLPYERLSGQTISTALAELLYNNKLNKRHRKEDIEES